MACLVVLLLGFALGGSAEAGSLDRLRQSFASPAATYRALPMAFDHNKPDQYASDLAEGGWGGALFSYPGGAKYLTDEDGWRKFEASVQACKKRGLDVWIYDENGYPSGRAGGLTLEGHPEFEARGLFYDSRDVHAGAAETIEWKLPEGKPFYVAMCPMSLIGTISVDDAVDLTDRVRDGVLRAQVEKGSWRLVAFVENRLYAGTHAVLTGGAPYINIMDPEAVRRFLDVTHERYYAHCGEEFGKTVKAFFNDEASLMGGFLAPETQPYPVVSWYHGLPAILKARTGRDVRTLLPALFNNVGANTTVYRCEFYSTVGRVIADSYFGQIRKWCESHKVASTGHLLWEESLLYHAAFYGTVFPSLSEFDWPGIDVLGCNRRCTSGSHIEGGPVTPKLISSAAHLYGKKRTMTESFCFVTGKTPVEELIGHVAWQWVLGINCLSVLSIDDQYDKPTFRRLNEFTGRVGSVLTQGRFAADVAVLYPIASVWADFVPSRSHVSYAAADSPSCARVDEAWRQVSAELLACQRDFDYLDEDAIDSAKVSGGAIGIGENSYRVLVLPNASVLRRSALAKIAEFVEGGGCVVSYKSIPCVREDAGSSEEFAECADRIWGSESRRKGKVIHTETLRALAGALGRCGKPDMAVKPASRDIYYQHRVLDSADAYFVVNNSAEPFAGDFTFRATGGAQVWDPASGTTKPLRVRVSSGLSTARIEVPPLSGLLVVFERG